MKIRGSCQRRKVKRTSYNPLAEYDYIVGSFFASDLDRNI